MIRTTHLAWKALRWLLTLRGQLCTVVEGTALDLAQLVKFTPALCQLWALGASSQWVVGRSEDNTRGALRDRTWFQ